MPAKGWSALAYFTLIGFAYMFNEMAFIQRFILFLGQPVYSVALVISTLLVSSGIGSVFSNKLGRGTLKLVLPAVALLSLVYIQLLPAVFSLLIQETLLTRVLASIVLLTPLGFLMGMPFPLMLKSAGDMTPRVWAVNGCASVLGSASAIILAVSQGFTAVQAAAAAAYLLALVFSSASTPPQSEGQTPHP